jgi:hypothetical protein
MTLILTYLSAIAFIIYGSLILLTGHMRSEFERYGMTRFRLLTGILELLGGIGLLVGLYYNPLYLLSSLGLSTLMLMGTITRMRVQDKVLEILPAILLMLINLFLFIQRW